mgnify:FL=1
MRQINFGNKQKICITCSVPLEIKEAGSEKGNCYSYNYNKTMYLCNTCHNKQRKKIYKKKRSSKTIGSTYHIGKMQESARARAKKKNLPYDLPRSYLRKIMTDTCPVLKIKFELNKKNQKWGKGKNKNNWENSPSIDRIVPAKGYTKDNVIIVSLMANLIKSQATPDQILKVGKFYKKLYQEKGIINEL